MHYLTAAARPLCRRRWRRGTARSAPPSCWACGCTRTRRWSWARWRMGCASSSCPTGRRPRALRRTSRSTLGRVGRACHPARARPAHRLAAPKPLRGCTCCPPARPPACNALRSKWRCVQLRGGAGLTRDPGLWPLCCAAGASRSPAPACASRVPPAHRPGSPLGCAAVDEGEREQGIAHLVEHVTFLGSKKREGLLGTGARWVAGRGQRGLGGGLRASH